MELSDEAKRLIVKQEDAIEAADEALLDGDVERAVKAFETALAYVENIREQAEEWVSEDLENDEYFYLGMYAGIIASLANLTRIAMSPVFSHVPYPTMYHYQLRPNLLRMMIAAAASFAYLEEEDYELIRRLEDKGDAILTEDEATAFNNIVSRLMG